MRPPGTSTLTKYGAGTSSDKGLPISDAAAQLASRAPRPVDAPPRNWARTGAWRLFYVYSLGHLSFCWYFCWYPYDFLIFFIAEYDTGSRTIIFSKIKGLQILHL